MGGSRNCLKYWQILYDHGRFSGLNGAPGVLNFPNRGRPGGWDGAAAALQVLTRSEVETQSEFSPDPSIFDRTDVFSRTAADAARAGPVVLPLVLLS
ncbi:hypothetical protein ACN2XU_16775 [Primorskyibacter sp. 2E107]|uniref:hypothetical protein n=1 Tax=Primorskyibacter sp. 2E107 TaxID=3403458 RepID=UPI003AF70851